MARWAVADQRESEEWLHGMLDDHLGEVLLILRSSARSGMSRCITPLIVSDGLFGASRADIRYLGFNIARLMGLSWNHVGSSVRVQGGGMDMGFHLVSGVSQRLYGDPCRLTHRWL